MRRYQVLWCAAALAAGAVSVQAAVIEPGPAPSLNVTSVPSPGSLGYQFYSVNGGPSDYSPTPPTQITGSPPSWATVAYTTQGTYEGTGYSSLNIAGTPSTPGFTFAFGGGSATAPKPLATITLGAGTPSSFQLGFLEGLTNNGGDDTSLIVSSTGTGTQLPSSQTINAPAAGNMVQNNFYYVDVTGAAPGDIISVNGYSTGNAGLGGITFDAVSASVPEPASLGILALSGLFLARRRRRQA